HCKLAVRACRCVRAERFGLLELIKAVELGMCRTQVRKYVVAHVLDATRLRGDARDQVIRRNVRLDEPALEARVERAIRRVAARVRVTLVPAVVMHGGVMRL